jgi:hypothetical protein
MAVDGKTTAALDYGAEAWLAEISITHAPTARATDALGKYGARPEEGDDFRERIYHAWTIGK